MGRLSEEIARKKLRNLFKAKTGMDAFYYSEELKGQVLNLYYLDFCEDIGAKVIIEKAARGERTDDPGQKGAGLKK